MRLAAKLISVVILILTVSLLVDGKLALDQEVAVTHRQAAENGRLVGHALRTLLLEVGQRIGRAGAIQLLREANTNAQRWSVRWVEPGAAAETGLAPRTTDGDLSALALGRDVQLFLPRPDGGHDLITYVPARLAPDRPGAIEVSESLVWLDERIASQRVRTLVKIGLLVLIGAALIIGLGLLFVGRPLNRLIARAEQIGSGDLCGELVLSGRDELSQLARALNEMCRKLTAARQRADEEASGRIAAVEQLRHEDRLKTVGLLASGIAHEMGTPLNVVSGRAGLIASGDLPAEQVRSSAETIVSQTERMTGIIRQLLDFARRPKSARTEVDLTDLIQETLDMLGPLAAKSSVRLRFERGTEDLHFAAEATGIQQVLTNLVLNGIQAMPQGGEIRLRAGLDERPLGGAPDSPPEPCVRFSVEDEGEGIAPEAIPRLFDPFYTTKDVGQGTGLGLSIAYGIVREHEGRIEVESEPRAGSTITVFLPRGGS